jgi:hypothetical protein
VVIFRWLFDCKSRNRLRSVSALCLVSSLAEAHALWSVRSKTL